MYNLLVTAQDGAWDKDFYLLDRSRFLEYTSTEISEKFKKLTTESIEAIISYPCIFAYEGRDTIFRIGNITTITEQGRNLRIEYQLDENIRPIQFQEIEDIAPLLDIREWEMNRTHWAIKDENLFERLERIIGRNRYASVIEPKSIESIHKVDESKNTVNTVQEFISQVLSEKHPKTTEVFYRGHSNKEKYKLEPSLFRKDEKGNYLYLENEDIMYRELLVSNSEEFSEDVYTLDRLVRMQHYSLPTRLLDITSNPLIALYFACKSGNKDVDGEVITFKLDRNDVKYFDSDTASCIANLARHPYSKKSKIKFDAENFNVQRPVEQLLHLIRDEKPFFEPRINKEDLRRVICVKSKKSNERITSQSGAFLLFGLDAVLDEQGTPEIQVERITIKNKPAILDELDLLNINERTVFPNIENSAKYVASKYEFNK